MIRSLPSLTTLALAACPLVAQGPPMPKPNPKTLPTLPVPEAQPSGRVSSNPIKEVVRAELSAAETGTPEALTASLYAFISGAKDVKRDVEKIRALFHPQARLMVAAKHPERGAFLRPMDLEAFLTFAVPQWEKGFFERSTAVTVTQHEGLAQVWSPYEIRLEAEGPAMYTGINALQCAWDGKRWWITHLEFQSAPTAALLASVGAPPDKAKEEPKK